MDTHRQDESLHSVVAREMARVRPRRVISVGFRWDPLTLPDELLDYPDARSLPPPTDPHSRVDLAIAVHPVRNAECNALDDDFRGLIAELRDQRAERVLAVVSFNGDPEDEQALRAALRSLGFDHLCRARAAESDNADDDVLVSRFELARYKATPTWLNSRHWANPEMWNRHRW